MKKNVYVRVFKGSFKNKEDLKSTLKNIELSLNVFLREGIFYKKNRIFLNPKKCLKVKITKNTISVTLRYYLKPVENPFLLVNPRIRIFFLGNEIPTEAKVLFLDKTYGKKEKAFTYYFKKMQWLFFRKSSLTVYFRSNS
jgi:hypothetical protein